MGVFDIVEITCSCGNVIEEQSKAGECLLNRYSIDRVPEAIACDLQGEKGKCDRCGKVYELDFGIDKNPVYYRGRVE